jgi:mannonate dehydratase
MAEHFDHRNAKSADGIKLCIAISPIPNGETLRFIRQLGVDHVYTWVADHQRGFEFLIRLRETVESHGLTLYNAGNYSLGKSPDIHLALPGRDRDIALFQQFLRDLGRAGIHHTTFTWEPNGVWTSGQTETRGGAITRTLDQHNIEAEPLSHGRVYSEDEIWGNFGYFMQAIIPVAEEADVRLCLHPNDPPMPSIAGVPSLIHNRQCYERALSIADSDYLGLEFCTGCWLEGGPKFGDLLEDIRFFGEKGKIFIVHFRSVDATLPKFSETFVDGGYMNMYEAMNAFCEVGFHGTMILDHTPKFDPLSTRGPNLESAASTGNGLKAETAYAIGYMKALLERANADKPRIE